MFAKKSLGQNWLISQSAIDTIVATGELGATDTVLEIGPGQGALTKKLLATGATVIAIEKDRELIPILEEKFAPEIKQPCVLSSGQSPRGIRHTDRGCFFRSSMATGHPKHIACFSSRSQAVEVSKHRTLIKNKKLTIIEQDVLEFDPKIIGSEYKLIANIPYYLTGQIIRKFLSSKNSPTKAVLLVQKEVAERIVARDGKNSLLSIAVKIFGEPKYIKKVPAGAFRPIPKVDSAILLIDNINQNKLKLAGVSEKKFFAILHRGFAQKRKLLASNLKTPSNVLVECGVGEKARAENLTVENWLCLATKIS